MFCAHRSLACSCVHSSKATGNCADLKATGPSFVGTVIDIENPPDERRFADQSALSRYRFRVDENISGFEEKEVDVYSGRGGGDCSYHFRMAQSYLVTPCKGTADEMAFYGAEPGKLMAGICTETQPVANAVALLAELRARKRGSVVEGVLRTKEQPNDYNHEMPDITVELRGKDTTLSTQTDTGGFTALLVFPQERISSQQNCRRIFRAWRTRRKMLPRRLRSSTRYATQKISMRCPRRESRRNCAGSRLPENS
jgi:hypothetical protein